MDSTKDAWHCFLTIIASNDRLSICSIFSLLPTIPFPFLYHLLHDLNSRSFLPWSRLAWVPLKVILEIPNRLPRATSPFSPAFWTMTSKSCYKFSSNFFSLDMFLNSYFQLPILHVVSSSFFNAVLICDNLFDSLDNSIKPRATFSWLTQYPA